MPQAILGSSEDQSSTQTVAFNWTSYLCFRMTLDGAVLKTLFSQTIIPKKNKAIADCRLHPWCCHLESYLRPSRSRLQEVVLSGSGLQRAFLRAMPKAACQPHCLSLAATSSSLSLCANMTSSIKLEICKVSLRRQRSTKPQPYMG